MLMAQKTDFTRATYDCTRQLEYFMSEYCNDLFELWELLEQIAEELEVHLFWSCRVESECFALHKETVDEGLRSKPGRKMWMGFQNAMLLHGQVFVLSTSASVGHPLASQYQIL